MNQTEAKGFLPLFLLGNYFTDPDQAITIWRNMMLNFNYYPATVMSATKMIPVPEGDDAMSIFAMLYFFQMMDPAEFSNNFVQGTSNFDKAAAYLSGDINRPTWIYGAPTSNGDGSYSQKGLETPGASVSLTALLMALASAQNGQINAQALTAVKAATRLRQKTNRWSVSPAGRRVFLK